MAYLSGNPITEKLALAKRVTFEAVLTCALNTAPTVVITSPAHASGITLQFASGATTATGSLTGNAYTGLSDMTGAAASPVFAIEVLDGLAKEFIGVDGLVTATSGAGNAAIGAAVFSISSSGTVTSGNLAVKATCNGGSLNAASGTVRLLITVLYT